MLLRRDQFLIGNHNITLSDSTMILKDFFPSSAMKNMKDFRSVKEMKRHFKEEETQRARNHILIKSYPASLVNNEIQMKITLKYYFLPLIGQNLTF